MRHKRINKFILTGLLFLLAALCLTGYNVLKDMRASADSAKVLAQMEFAAGEITDVVNENMELLETEIDNIPYIGAIEIPVLGLQLPVASYWDQTFAASAPCRYTGSPYTENMIIAGHNFRHHFSRLRNLNTGDEVVFTDLSGKSFHYRVAGIEEVDGYDIEKMKAGDWDLTLFTCNFSGRARIAVRCTAY